MIKKTDLQWTSPEPVMTTRDILDMQRVENERLRILVDFLHRPVCAYGGPDPDPDIITTYNNLAVEASLNGIRRAALGSTSIHQGY